MVLSRIMATSVVVGTLLFSGTALAPSQEDEKCWRKVEDYDVHFSIFQAAFGDRPFCQDAPTTGDTALTLDFTDPALRQMPTEVRVIEADVVGRGPGPRSRRRGQARRAIAVQDLFERYRAPAAQVQRARLLRGDRRYPGLDGQETRLALSVSARSGCRGQLVACRESAPWSASSRWSWASSSGYSAATASG